MIREWKRKHVERINSLFGAVEYPDRASARKAIEPALTENRAVFDQYGPNNDYRQDPESEFAKVWQQDASNHPAKQPESPYNPRHKPPPFH